MFLRQCIKDVSQFVFIHLLLHTQQSRIIVNLSGYNIELTTGRLLIRIHIVPLTSC